jgi:hypothetical protein
MYHQLTTIQVNVLHHRLAAAKMLMLFCKLSTTKAGVHHGSREGCRKELARGINFLSTPLFIFVCFLNT